MWWILLAGAAGAYYLTQTPKGKQLVTSIVPQPALVATLAQRWAGVWQVPAAWIAAIVAVESAGRPGATNQTGGDAARGGAWGLMQMTAKTASGLAPQMRTAAGKMAPDARAAILATLNRWDGTGPGLLDPDVNVCFGAFYLAQLSKTLGGNFAAVAAGYNGGPAAGKSIAAGKGASSAVVAYVGKATKALGGVA